LYSHIRIVRGSTPEQASFDVTVMSERGRVLLEAHDFTMRRLTPSDMAARAAQPARAESPTLLATWLASGIDAHDGTRLLDRVLRASLEPEVVISSIPLDVLRAQSSASTANAARQDSARALASEERPSGEVETDLAQMWRDLLGVTTVGANDDFFEL